MRDESGKEGFEILGVDLRWVWEFLFGTAFEDQGSGVCGGYGEEEEGKDEEVENKWRVVKGRSHLRRGN